MILTVLLGLFVLAAALSYLRWRRLAGLAMFVGVAVFFAISCGPLAGWLATTLQDGYAADPAIDWSRRSVIVLLGAGTERLPTARVEVGTLAYPRVYKALELYLACRRAQGPLCRLIVSGGDPQGHGASEAGTYAERLLAAGVDRADLIVEGASLNTWQNAQFCRPLLQQAAAGQVILVTSGIHMRRSLVYFSHFDIHPLAVRADYLTASPSWQPSAYNLAVADWTLHEYLGIWRYQIYNRLGWNTSPVLHDPLPPVP